MKTLEVKENSRLWKIISKLLVQETLIESVEKGEIEVHFKKEDVTVSIKVHV